MRSVTPGSPRQRARIRANWSDHTGAGVDRHALTARAGHQITSTATSPITSTAGEVRRSTGSSNKNSAAAHSKQGTTK